MVQQSSDEESEDSVEEEGEEELSENDEEKVEEESLVSEAVEGETNPLMPNIQFGSKSFKDVNVSPWLITNLETVEIRKPTLIQEETLQHSIKGKNVIGCAHTGSGKTACFAIPILQKLAKDPFGIFALIVTPTRELAF